jgi:hypothetical protein
LLFQSLQKISRNIFSKYCIFPKRYNKCFLLHTFSIICISLVMVSCMQFLEGASTISTALTLSQTLSASNRAILRASSAALSIVSAATRSATLLVVSASAVAAWAAFTSARASLIKASASSRSKRIFCRTSSALCKFSANVRSSDEITANESSISRFSATTSLNWGSRFIPAIRSFVFMIFDLSFMTIMALYHFKTPTNLKYDLINANR